MIDSRYQTSMAARNEISSHTFSGNTAGKGFFLLRFHETGPLLLIITYRAQKGRWSIPFPILFDTSIRETGKKKSMIFYHTSSMWHAGICPDGDCKREGRCTARPSLLHRG